MKFQNNPQGPRVLANDLLGSSLAKLLHLPVPEVAVIDVREELIQYSQRLTIDSEHGAEPCQAGLCFGSQLVENGRCFLPRYFPVTAIENPADLLGMLAFDKWTSNTDWRQLVFSGPLRGYSYSAVMIDQGDCFGRGRWKFLNSPVLGLCQSRQLYATVEGLHDFERWLHPLENNVTLGMLRETAEAIPPEWYQYDRDALSRLLRKLDRRRALVRQLLRSTLRACHDYFPNALETRAIVPAIESDPSPVAG